jgi:hypothetical protein
VACRLVGRYHIKTLLASEENLNREVFHKLLAAMMPLMARTVTTSGLAATSKMVKQGRGGGGASGTPVDDDDF